MADRERIGREASPSAAIIDSQSVKTAEAGGPRGIDRRCAASACLVNLSGCADAVGVTVRVQDLLHFGVTPSTMLSFMSHFEPFHGWRENCVPAPLGRSHERYRGGPQVDHFISEGTPMIELLLLFSRLAARLGFPAQAEDYRLAAAYIRGMRIERKRRLYA